MHLHFKNKSSIPCYHFNITIVDNLIYHKTTDFETIVKICPVNIQVIQGHNTYSGVAQFVKAEFQVCPRWSFALSI